MISYQAILHVSLLIGSVFPWNLLTKPDSSSKRFVFRRCMVQESTHAEHSVSSLSNHQQSLKNSILYNLVQHSSEANHWATQYGLDEDSGAIFYALFYAIRSSAKLGLRGHPLFLTEGDIRLSAADFLNSNNQLAGFFTFDDLTQALEEDFLDANRGIANSKREAWKVRRYSSMIYLLLLLLLLLVIGRFFDKQIEFL